MIRGLLKSWGVSDDEIEIQIKAAKDSLFQETSSGRFLDALGSNVGVSRTPGLGLDDGDVRTLIPVLSFKPKQVRRTIIDLLDVFWGAGFTRPNITASNVQPYNFGPASVLTGTVTFINGNRIVKGTGTSFTTEVFPGDYIKPTAADGTEYSKVSKIVDDVTLELSVEWAYEFSLNTMVSKGITRELQYRVDDRISKTIRFTPNAFSDITAVTVIEIANFINTHPEHRDLITASEFLDPIFDSRINIRTNTPGIQGSIQITGGSANDPSRLNFLMDKRTEVKAGVFEVNPNEIVVQIPSSVPVLRRTLKGAIHPKDTKTEIFSLSETFDFSGLGTSSTLNVDVDGSPYTVSFFHAADFADSTAVTSEEIVDVINDQLQFLKAFTSSPFPKRIGLRTSEGSSEYQVTGGTANTVLDFDTALQQDPDLIVAGYPSAYTFDPLGQLFTVTGISSELAGPITAGTLSATLTLNDASSFPNRPGKFLIDFGRANQEGPVSYNSRPNNSTLLIDASYIFQFDHDGGRSVNFVTDKPTIPRVTGDDYAVYIVGTEEARAAAQDLIRKLLAAGVVIRFIISFPEVMFECVCRDCGPPIDANYRGFLTGSPPLTF